MDIIIYTTPETLEHKKGVDSHGEYFWYLSRPPISFVVGDRIYFAVKGNIVGSFRCEEFNPEKNKYGDPITDETIVWNSESWIGIGHPIPCKHFQGFKYRNFEKEEEK